MNKKVDEIKTADKILKIVYDALAGGQFNYHVAKLKGKSGETNGEDILETKLKAIDTKRLLEAVTALEKIINVKKRVYPEEQEKESAGKVVLPEVVFPEEVGGDEP